MHHVIFLARRKSRVEIRSSELHVLTASSGGKAKGAGLLQPGPANAACSWRPLRGSELRLYPTTGFSVQRQSSRNAEPVRCFRSRSFKFRWEHSPAWAAHPTGDLTLKWVSLVFGLSVAGHPGITHYTSACTFSRFGTKPMPHARNGQFCSDLKRPQDYKSDSRSAVSLRVTSAKEKYEN